MKLVAPAGLRARRAVARVAGDARGRIARHLDRCTPRDRLVLSLLVFEGLTPAEVAEALDLSPRTVRRVHAALLAELRRVARGMASRPSRRPQRPRAVTLVRQRRAA